jgi:hypothetical protein
LNISPFVVDIVSILVIPEAFFVEKLEIFLQL